MSLPKDSRNPDGSIVGTAARLTEIRPFAVINAFRKGKLPSNVQIDGAIDHILAYWCVDTVKLSPDSRNLVNRARKLLQTTLSLVHEQNRGQLIQKFVWRTRTVDVGGSQNHAVGELDKNVRGDATTTEAQDPAVEHLRSVLLIVLNSDVRKLLCDLSLIGRDLLSTTAQKNFAAATHYQSLPEGGLPQAGLASGYTTRLKPSSNDREEFIIRAKKVITQWQAHAGDLEAIFWLLKSFAEYAKRGPQTSEETEREGTDVSDLSQGISELKNLLEVFAGGQSLDPIKNALDVLISDAQADPKFAMWLAFAEHLLQKVLFDPCFVLKPRCEEALSRMCGRGYPFLEQKYAEHFDVLFQSVSDWFKALSQGSVYADFWAELAQLKPRSSDIRDIIKAVAPALVGQCFSLPIPCIEINNDTLDFVLDNITLKGRELFPKSIDIDELSSGSFRLTLRGIHAEMKDVEFYYKLKTGMKTEHSGVVDVTVGGEGSVISIDLVPTPSDPASIFKVGAVHVDVHALEYVVRGSNHDFLYNALRWMVLRRYQYNVQCVVRDAVVAGLEHFGRWMVFVRDQLDGVEVVVPVGKDAAMDGKDEENESTPPQAVAFKVEQPEKEKEDAPPLGAAQTAKSETGRSRKKAGADAAALPKPSFKSDVRFVWDTQDLLIDERYPEWWVNRAAAKEREREKQRWVYWPWERLWKSNMFNTVFLNYEL